VRELYGLLELVTDLGRGKMRKSSMIIWDRSRKLNDRSDWVVSVEVWP
jgi:hypothetical protein